MGIQGGTMGILHGTMGIRGFPISALSYPPIDAKRVVESAVFS